MAETQRYYPHRRMGAIFQGILILVLIVVMTWGLWGIANSISGLALPFYILAILVSIVLLPVMMYRIYSLFSASYEIGSDGIRLQWGLRIEQIPMDNIEWVHPADDLEPSVPLPRLRWPGAVLGSRKVNETGRVEFFAATTKYMLVIATPEVAYAISPADPQSFQVTVQSCADLDSLEPLSPVVTRPRSFVYQAWTSRLVKTLIISGFVLNVILLIFALNLYTTFNQVSLGFTPGGRPRDMVPSIRIFLLPVLSGVLYVFDLVLGILFYGNEENRVLSYLLWGFGVITPCLFIIGALFIMLVG